MPRLSRVNRREFIKTLPAAAATLPVVPPIQEEPPFIENDPQVIGAPHSNLDFMGTIQSWSWMFDYASTGLVAATTALYYAKINGGGFGIPNQTFGNGGNDQARAIILRRAQLAAHITNAATNKAFALMMAIVPNTLFNVATDTLSLNGSASKILVSIIVNGGQQHSTTRVRDFTSAELQTVVKPDESVITMFSSPAGNDMTHVNTTWAFLANIEFSWI